ncbi:MAG: pantetheine-phosphate adenylyltransferase [Pirellulales bacterium]|nr:pantetheine-phosphate adenylyltransferase [Pirellulales bacterium]
MSNSPRLAVYTGSFDPITLGHLNIIERASKLVDQLIVGIGVNIEKQSLFTPEERLELVQKAIPHLVNVSVRSYTGLTVKFIREVGARVMLRGIRSLTDIESEFTMTLANRKLDAGIETIFLMADDEFSHISSSLLKQITPLADDAELCQFVPRAIIADLRQKFPRTG